MNNYTMVTEDYSSINGGLPNETAEYNTRKRLGMDTNVVAFRDGMKKLVFWRWKVMRQVSEVAQHMVNLLRLSYEENGVKSGVIWLDNLRPFTSFEINDSIADKICEMLKTNPCVASVEKIGDVFFMEARSA